MEQKPENPHHERHGHRFIDIGRLRSPERLARLEVDRVVGLALTGLPAQSALDIGTGTGVFAEAFSQRGLRVAGIDVNPEMLPYARQYAPQASFETGPAEHLPFGDGAFDLAFMGLVLHETDDLLQALREAFRVSRLRVAVLEWPYQEQEFGPGMDERLQPEAVEALAKEAGFGSVQVVPLNTLVLYLLEKRKTAE